MNYARRLSPFRRKLSTKRKLLVVTDEQVLNDVNNNVYNPRKHPGVMPKLAVLPQDLVKAITVAAGDYSLKTLHGEGEVLTRHLQRRLMPLEKRQLNEKLQRTQEKVLSTYNVNIKSEEDEKRLRQSVNNKTLYALKSQMYNWQPMQYDAYNSLVYLVGRAAPEYAVLFKIMGEISARDPAWKPRSLFDFGSGIGTATWAAIAYWKNHIFEYFNVDSSRDMNDLAEILLRGGTGSGKMSLKGVFHRQFLPASAVMYDIVVCAYTLCEFSSARNRLQTVVSLWNKTAKYLIIVEQGTNAGFKLVNEARDFVLQISSDSSNVGHVFSPCPHDDACPRLLLEDGTPCNFEINYRELLISGTSHVKTERYSYVVLRKGPRSEADPGWPRVVRPTLVRSKHSICRVCTAAGKLDEIIFTASKHGKMTYYCARNTKWGDLLPVKTKDEGGAENEIENDEKN